MPTAVGPNTKGEENLVFGYDLGDISNSYKGEPATNSQDYDKSVMTQAGFDAWGCYDGNNSSPNYHYWGNAQSKTLVNIPGPEGKYVNAMLYHNFTGGFHGPTNWSGVASSLLTNGSKITVQGWVKAADAASVGKTVSPHLYYNKIGGGSYSSSTSYTLTAEWQLVSHSYTVPEGSTGAGTMYFFTSGGTNIKMYLTNTAIVGGRAHAIQWLPGGSTRSATEGLLDLTGNSTIDLTNVSFDSNAQMTFDGTNDYIQSSEYTIPSTGPFTVEFLYRRSTAGGRGGLFERRPGSPYNGMSLGQGASNNWAFVVASNLDTEKIQADFTYPSANVWYHDVGVFNGTNTVQAFRNGELTDSTTGATIGNLDTGGTRDKLLIMKRDNASSTVGGDVAIVKIYNRALTASEIKANYNAIKGRFNI